MKYKKFFDFAMLLLVAFVGYSALGFLFSSDAFIYDDNSFHFATLKYTLTQAIPTHHRIIDWNPNWFAGIPELQFYPPGFTLLGAIIYYFSFTLLTPETIYQIGLILVFFLPALSGYFLLRKAGFSWWVSGISALFLLTYSETASGVLYGVIMGLSNSRLAIGLFPLILGIFILCMEQEKKVIYKLLLALLIFFTLLAHPYHIFLPLLGIIAQLYAWSHIGLIQSKNNARRTFMVVLAGIGLASFWWIPLIVHSSYVAQMQVWTGGSKLRDLIHSLSGDWTEKYFVVLYCICAMSLLYSNYTEKRKAILAGLLLTPVFMLAFLFIIRLVLMGLFRINSIDPWRLQDDFIYSIILLSGVTFGFLVEQIIDQWNSTKNTAIKLINCILLGLLLILSSTVGLKIISLTYHFKGYGNFAFLRQTRISLRLDDLWNYLNDDSKERILFTASHIPFPGKPNYIHSHVLSLTPAYTQRPILGGVNEPFYSTASFFYFGKKPPAIIREEADMLDNHSLFGIPWEQMTDDMFWNLCRHFNVSTIVVSDSEPNALEFMSKTKRFIPIQVIGPFHLYHPKDLEFSWLQMDDRLVDARIESFRDDSIVVKINSSRKDAILIIKVGYYPRWKAYIDKKRIPIKSDEAGLMRIRLPAGNNYLVFIQYESTWVEKLGWIVTLFILVVLVGIAIKKDNKPEPLEFP